MLSGFVFFSFVLPICYTYKSPESRNITSRIINGEDVKSNEEYPYNAIIYNTVRFRFLYEYVPLAMGSIIGPKYILTSASYFEGAIMKYLSVRVASIEYSRGGVHYNVESVRSHPQYQNRTYFNIAVITLTKGLKYSPKVYPVKLPKQLEELPRPGFEGNVLGWGITKKDHYEKRRPRILQVTKMSLMRHSECNYLYKDIRIDKRNAFDEYMFCASSNVDSDVCFGDNGAGFVVNDTIYGTFSWHIECGNDNFPSVFVSVPSDFM